MVEIRLDDDLYTYDGEFKNALIFVLASLTGNDESTLAPTYEKYDGWTDENLIQEILELTDKKLNIVFNFEIDANISVKQHILDN
ncbi:TPA: hypothetical protein ACG7RU_001760 [Streptococcus agalactiae]